MHKPTQTIGYAGKNLAHLFYIQMNIISSVFAEKKDLQKNSIPAEYSHFYLNCIFLIKGMVQYTLYKHPKL